MPVAQLRSRYVLASATFKMPYPARKPFVLLFFAKAVCQQLLSGEQNVS
ncbi:hypothetical protein [Mucilaginibacter sp. KACC 22063]|nr:hypothetical protein [Mucilaginibacter sp. KACC 22063]WDF54762.1 hypothetical protein PQ461_17670 [Mucilaginibacter sp. KACC 22063]